MSGLVRYSEKMCGLLAELLDVECQLGLQVGSLVLVNDVDLCELVERLLNAGVHLCCDGLVGRGTKLAHCITHGLGVIAVVESSLLLLTDAL